MASSLIPSCFGTPPLEEETNTDTSENSSEVLESGSVQPTIALKALISDQSRKRRSKRRKRELKTLTQQQLDGPYWSTNIVNTRTVELRKKVSSSPSIQNDNIQSDEVIEETVEEGKVTQHTEQPKKINKKKKTPSSVDLEIEDGLDGGYWTQLGRRSRPSMNHPNVISDESSSDGLYDASDTEGSEDSSSDDSSSDDDMIDNQPLMAHYSPSSVGHPQTLYDLTDDTTSNNSRTLHKYFTSHPHSRSATPSPRKSRTVQEPPPKKARPAHIPQSQPRSIRLHFPIPQEFTLEDSTPFSAQFELADLPIHISDWPTPHMIDAIFIHLQSEDPTLLPSCHNAFNYLETVAVKLCENPTELDIPLAQHLQYHLSTLCTFLENRTWDASKPLCQLYLRAATFGLRTLPLLDKFHVQEHTEEFSESSEVTLDSFGQVVLRKLVVISAMYSPMQDSQITEATKKVHATWVTLIHALNAQSGFWNTFNTYLKVMKVVPGGSSTQSITEFCWDLLYQVIPLHSFEQTGKLNQLPSQHQYRLTFHSLPSNWPFVEYLIQQNTSQLQTSLRRCLQISLVWADHQPLLHSVWHHFEGSLVAALPENGSVSFPLTTEWVGSESPEDLRLLVRTSRHDDPFTLYLKLFLIHVCRAFKLGSEGSQDIQLSKFIIGFQNQHFQRFSGIVEQNPKSFESSLRFFKNILSVYLCLGIVIPSKFAATLPGMLTKSLKFNDSDMASKLYLIEALSLLGRMYLRRGIDISKIIKDIMSCMDELITTLVEHQSQKEALEKKLDPQGQQLSSQMRVSLVQSSQATNALITQMQAAIGTTLDKCTVLVKTVAAHSSLWTCLHLFIDKPLGRLLDIGCPIPEYLRLAAASLVSLIIKCHLELAPTDDPADNVQSSQDIWEQFDMDQLEALLKRKNSYEQAEKNLVENLDRTIYQRLQSLLATKQPRVQLPVSSLGRINPDSIVAHDSLEFFIQSMVYVAIVMKSKRDILIKTLGTQSNFISMCTKPEHRHIPLMFSYHLAMVPSPLVQSHMYQLLNGWLLGMVEYNTNFIVEKHQTRPLQVLFTNYLLLAFSQTTPAYFEGLDHLKCDSVEQFCAQRLILLNGFFNNVIRHWHNQSDNEELKGKICSMFESLPLVFRQTLTEQSTNSEYVHYVHKLIASILNHFGELLYGYAKNPREGCMLTQLLTFFAQSKHPRALLSNLPEVLRPLAKLPYYTDDNVLKPYAQVIHFYVESITLRDPDDMRKLEVLTDFLTGLEVPHLRWFFEATFLRKYLLRPKQQGTISVALLICQQILHKIKLSHLETDLSLILPLLINCFWAKQKVTTSSMILAVSAIVLKLSLQDAPLQPGITQSLDHLLEAMMDDIVVQAAETILVSNPPIGPVTPQLIVDSIQFVKQCINNRKNRLQQPEITLSTNPDHEHWLLLFQLVDSRIPNQLMYQFGIPTEQELNRQFMSSVSTLLEAMYRSQWSYLISSTVSDLQRMFCSPLHQPPHFYELLKAVLPYLGELGMNQIEGIPNKPSFKDCLHAFL